MPTPGTRECKARPEVRAYIFGRLISAEGEMPTLVRESIEETIVLWMRVKQLQLESLRQIATKLLLTTPSYRGMLESQLRVHYPGEVRLQTLELSEPLSLYCSKANQGALIAARELSTRLRDVNITITEKRHHKMNRLPEVRHSSSGSVFFGERRGSAVNASRRGSIKPPRRASTLRRLSLSLSGQEQFTVGLEVRSHSRNMMLLYLNEKTWDHEGSDSSKSLSNEVMRAVANDIDLVMVHEADVSRHGCEFGVFFQTT